MLKVFVAIGFLQILTMLFQLVRTKVLAVLLGPEAIGVMAVIDKLLAVIAQTASLSFPFAAVRFLPGVFHRDRREFAAVLRSMQRILLTTVGLATLLALGVTVLAPQLWGKGLYPYRHVMLIAVLTIPVLAFIPFFQNVVAAQLRQNRAMTIAAGNAAVLTVASVAGVLLGGIAGSYAGYAIAGLAFALVVARAARGGTTSPEPSVGDAALEPPSGGLPPLLWQFSAAMLTLAFLTPYAALFVHYRVLSRIGAEAAGWMQAAIGVSIAVRGVLGSAHAVFLTPGVNRGGTPAERMTWASQFQSTLCLLVGLSVPLLLLFPQIAVGVLYSSQFAPGARYVALFVVVELIGLIASTYQSLIVAFDHLLFHVFQNVVAQLLLVVVAWQTIDRYGIAGAAASGLAAQLVLYIATTVFLRTRHGLRVPARTAALTAFVLIIAVGCGVIGAWWPTLSTGTVAVKVACYFTIVAVLLTFLSPSERQRLAQIASQLRARLQPVG
jgi:O-antigen/teichoic acid export membrane protein